MIDIDINLVDTMTESPIPFRVGDKRFYMYPATLGKTLLLAKLYNVLDINTKLLNVNPYAEAMRLCETKRDYVCRIIAYNTMQIKEELQDFDKVQERADFFAKELNIEDMTQLLVLSLSNDKMQELKDRYGYAAEEALKERIARIKKDKGSLTFGGKTLYGVVVDWACERYGWTMDYVLWGISYINLRMLMQDAINSVSLTKEERAKAKIYDNSEVLDAADPRNWDRIREMLKN